MKTSLHLGLVAFVALTPLTATLLADSRTHARSTSANDDEVAVFVTGSLIPQRVKRHPIGTRTVSPVRIIDRNEIDQTGRPTTPGAVINEPAARVIGH